MGLISDEEQKAGYNKTHHQVWPVLNRRWELEAVLSGWQSVNCFYILLQIVWHHDDQLLSFSDLRLGTPHVGELARSGGAREFSSILILWGEQQVLLWCCLACTLPVARSAFTGRIIVIWSLRIAIGFDSSLGLIQETALVFRYYCAQITIRARVCVWFVWSAAHSRIPVLGCLVLGSSYGKDWWRQTLSLSIYINLVIYSTESRMETEKCWWFCKELILFRTRTYHIQWGWNHLSVQLRISILKELFHLTRGQHDDKLCFLS